MPRCNAEYRRQERRERAEERKEAYKERTPQQQLEILDFRLGVNAGAVKERAELLRLIENKGEVDVNEITNA